MSLEVLILVFIASLIVGAFAGMGSGLFGLGGGIIVIPCLILIFRLADITSHSIVHLAIGTSVTGTTFSTLVSMIKHSHRKGIVKRSAYILAPCVVVGSVIGASVAHILTGPMLEIIFGCVLAILSLKYFFEREKKLSHEDPHHPILFLLTGGVCLGFLSGLLGVGGGFLIVPLLMFLDTPFRKSVGTASVTSFLITFITAICYLFYGMYPKPLSPYTYSLIFYPGAIGVAIGAVSTAPLGVKIAHNAPVKIIKKLFALVLLGAGISMIVNGS